jgi:hypothetical protein
MACPWTGFARLGLFLEIESWLAGPRLWRNPRIKKSGRSIAAFAEFLSLLRNSDSGVILPLQRERINAFTRVQLFSPFGATGGPRLGLFSREPRRFDRRTSIECNSFNLYRFNLNLSPELPWVLIFWCILFLYLFIFSSHRTVVCTQSAFRPLDCPSAHSLPFTRSISAMIAPIKSHSCTLIWFTSSHTRTALDVHRLVKPCLRKLTLIQFAL